MNISDEWIILISMIQMELCNVLLIVMDIIAVYNFLLVEINPTFTDVLINKIYIDQFSLSIPST